ncbi:MAG TPA: prepilin-type N-terminal cleavage/methylation domain-containing protein [Candidatus Koribacter sp.]|jgi:prepilin-type N-terminal cleavage/methylation domain-containing protein
MRAQNGFSVIELLIAIAIILVIAAIAVPEVLRSHVVANEATAVELMHRIDVAQSAYAATYGHYATALVDLGPPTAQNTKPSPAAAGLLENNLACKTQPCPVEGYAFAIQHTETIPEPSYHAVALPLRPGLSGGRGFCTDQSHRVLADPDGLANCRERLE